MDFVTRRQEVSAKMSTDKSSAASNKYLSHRVSPGLDFVFVIFYELYTY